MSQLLSMLSQYELLEWTAHYLTPRDLFHLALTNSQFYTLILKSDSIFGRLKRVTLCDGSGLLMRQEFGSPFYEVQHRLGVWGPNGRRPHYDEEIEVRVWNAKCDAIHALPCLKCGVNICEECRYVPRVRDQPGWQSRQRPHLDPSYTCHDIICYCTECDKKVEGGLPLSISTYCDCDQYKRWICLPCRTQEAKADAEYCDSRTEARWQYSASDDDFEDGRWLYSHQDELAYWCPCGARAPGDGNVRCSWCKKKHDLNTWRIEDSSRIPYFDNDPCYPRVEYDPADSDMERLIYSRLKYTGPIYQQPEELSSS